MADSPIVVDRFQLRRSDTPGYRPPINGLRALREGEAFFNTADSTLCIGTGLGPFVEFNLNLGGPPGPEGPEGPVGPIGPRGIDGPAGPTGVAGSSGAKGDKGDPGQTGAQGAQGALGPKGDQGIQGLAGPQGVQGERGLQGLQGDAGPQGAQGPKGDQGAGVTIKGSRTSPSALPATGNAMGDLYIMSTAGSGYADGDGYAYTGAGTDAGPGGNWKNVGPVRGPRGEQGLPGATGPKGDAGADGAQGPQGVQGQQGPQGARGDQGLQGVAGSKGDVGATGATGPQGSPTTVNGKTGTSITLSAADVGAPAKTGDTYTGQHFVPLAARRPTNSDITQRVEGGVYEGIDTEVSLAKGWPFAATYGHLIAATHSNQGNYFSFQLCTDFYNNAEFYVRATNNNGSQPWRRLWHDANFDAIAPTDAEFTAGTSTAKRPTVKQIADRTLQLSTQGGALRLLGFIGDGQPHPLSQRFSTLAAAQVVYPRATALTEEVDGHAIQKFVDLHHARANSGEPLVVELPRGCFARASKPIFTGKVATSVIGCNSYITQVTAGADGWVHGSASSGFQSAFGSRFEMRGVNLCCVGVGGTALYVEQDPRTGGFHMDAVRITGSGDLGANYWTRGVVGVGASDTLWEGVAIVGGIGGNLSTRSDGVYMTFDTSKFGAVQGAFFYRFNNCDVSWYGIGYNFLASKTIEGLYIQQGNINSCLRAVKFHNTTMDGGGGYPSPQFFIIDNQIECYGPYFDFKAVQNVKIKGNLFLVNGPRAGVADPGEFLWDWLSCGIGCADFSIYDNDFTFFDNCHPRYLFNVDAPGVLNFDIYDNSFSWIGNARPGGGIVNFGDAGNAKKNIREYSNDGLANYFWSVVVGSGQRANGCFSESRIVSALNGAGAGDRLVSINHDTGEVTVAGSRTAAPYTSGAARFIDVNLTAGVLKAKPNIILPTFGDDFGVASGYALAPSFGLATDTKIPVNVIGYTGTDARRICFQVTG